MFKHQEQKPNHGFFYNGPKKPYKPYKRQWNNAVDYKGLVNTSEYEEYPITSSTRNVELPAFQMNRFKDIVSLRLNLPFIKEALALSNSEKVKNEDVLNLIKDIEDLVSNKEECLVTENYHVGRIGNCIYLNMNNKCTSLLFEFFNSLTAFPPHILSFKQRLEKMSIQGMMYDSNKHDDNDDF